MNLGFKKSQTQNGVYYHNYPDDSRKNKEIYVWTIWKRYEDLDHVFEFFKTIYNISVIFETEIFTKLNCLKKFLYSHKGLHNFRVTWDKSQKVCKSCKHLQTTQKEVPICQSLFVRLKRKISCIFMNCPITFGKIRCFYYEEFRNVDPYFSLVTKYT